MSNISLLHHKSYFSEVAIKRKGSLTISSDNMAILSFLLQFVTYSLLVSSDGIASSRREQIVEWLMGDETQEEAGPL